MIYSLATGSAARGRRCATTSTGMSTRRCNQLWKQEGLQRRVQSPRKRGGHSSCPPDVVDDAPKVVWALDFQFDSTIDGKIKVSAPTG